MEFRHDLLTPHFNWNAGLRLALSLRYTLTRVTALILLVILPFGLLAVLFPLLSNPPELPGKIAVLGGLWLLGLLAVPASWGMLQWHKVAIRGLAARAPEPVPEGAEASREVPGWLKKTSPMTFVMAIPIAIVMSFTGSEVVLGFLLPKGHDPAELPDELPPRLRGARFVVARLMYGVDLLVHTLGVVVVVAITWIDFLQAGHDIDGWIGSSPIALVLLAAAALLVSGAVVALAVVTAVEHHRVFRAGLAPEASAEPAREQAQRT